MVIRNEDQKKPFGNPAPSEWFWDVHADLVCASSDLIIANMLSQVLGRRLWMSDEFCEAWGREEEVEEVEEGD